MLLVGLDAASQPENFGYAIGTLSQGRIDLADVNVLKSKHQPDALEAIVAPALQSAERALVAIDAPLGWPSKLGDTLSRHRAGEEIAAGKSVVFSRETDRIVEAKIGKRPLEIGADKIARAAHSALAALSRLRALTSREIPLAWAPSVDGVAAIEVYPGATLKARGIQDSGYKRLDAAGGDVRRRIAQTLEPELPVLARFIGAKADMFDACLCLIAAKDFLEADLLHPSDESLARREGWIWVRSPRP
jgi:predicted nuclease with RNAse H fold